MVSIDPNTMCAYFERAEKLIRKQSVLRSLNGVKIYGCADGTLVVRLQLRKMGDGIYVAHVRVSTGSI